TLPDRARALRLSGMSPTIPAPLKRGRRAVEGLPGVSLVGDFYWHAASDAWVARYRLTIDSPSALVPAVTDWYVRVQSNYPLGPIKVHPAKDRGLGATFPHQNYNRPGEGDVPWREGDI